jgi:putative membrane protein
MSDLYSWLKALHILSVIAWMAGMLYLPRLYVYHAGAARGSELSETFKTMERRLLRGIMNPAMGAVYVFGGLLAATPGLVDWAQGWIYAKLTLVGALTVLHHLCALWRKRFAEGRNGHGARFYRVVNELPMVAIILIVFLVVLKPF